MKKILISIITLTSVLTGLVSYSNTNKVLANTNQNFANNTVIANTSSVNNEQSYNNTNIRILASANTTKNIFDKGYHDYTGIIGKNISIQMSIYRLGNDIVGSYYYDSQKKDIKLKGKVGFKDIQLYEYDTNGKNTGIFKGTMNTDDKITGTWISGDKKRSYPFTLSLTSFLPGTEYGKRYATAVGKVSDKSVEDFAKKIQSYIANNNKKQLAESILYPINVKINNKIVKIQNKEAFIKIYDKIFYASFKKELMNSYAKNMFANWTGVMFGANLHNLWINAISIKNSTDKLMITAINN